MPSSYNKSLDPRLKRQVNAMSDESRLEQDLEEGLILTEADPGAPIDPQEVMVRVLVQLRTSTIPAGFSTLRWTNIIGNIYSLLIPVTSLSELANDPNVEYVEAQRTLSPLLDTALDETRAKDVQNPSGGQTAFTGAGVVVGIIDFGLDYTLDDFRHPNGTTRVAFLWDQSLVPVAGESSPVDFGYGVEYDEAAINQALNAADPFSEVRHNPGDASHGTHVASIAAGNGRSADGTFAAGLFVGAAPEATIIFVQPESGDQDSSFTDSVHVAEAIRYIFDRAEELNMPCVINMSLGQNGGSHDGESVVERAIDQFLSTSGRAFVSAAGNEHIWRGHTSGSLLTGENHVIHWRCGGGLPLPGGGVLPGGSDFTPNELEIWYSSRDRFRVTVTDPDGNQTRAVDPNDFEDHTTASGDKIFIDSTRFSPLNGDAQIYIEISHVQGTINPGVWEVDIESLNSREGDFNGWIERDFRRSTNNFADQSFFVGTDFDGAMTLGTPATAKRSIAVANYDHVAQVPSNSSSRGRTRDGRRKPEIAAPGTNIRAAGSLGSKPNPNHVPGNPNTGPQFFPLRVRKSGTSMAAPLVAGIVAMMLEKDPGLTSEQLRAMLIVSANPPFGVVPFDRAWGFGRVNARIAVDLV